MWSYFYLAGYVGLLNRPEPGPSFEDLARINRCREEDRRCGIMRARASHGGASGRAPHLRVIRYSGDDNAGGR